MADTDTQAAGSETELTLYYHPGSYYSQRVLMTLYEKGISFNRVIIDITTGKQQETWYAKINPKMTVPLLKDAEKFIVESDVIIDYLDVRHPVDPILVPDISSEKGQLVKKFRQLIDDVIMEIVTYGIIYHPDLPCVTGPLKAPAHFQQIMRGKHEKSIANLLKMADSDPAQRDVYLARHQVVSQRYNAMSDRTQVQQHIDDMDKLCNILNKQLKAANEGQSGQTWLCGPEFTAADVSLAIFLNRMNFLGLAFVTEKNPHIKRFQQQIFQRPAFQKVVQELKL